jgi:preprotein translocase subunit SecY
MGILINIFKLPELRKRVLFTLMMLAVYRLTTPGVTAT